MKHFRYFNYGMAAHFWQRFDRETFFIQTLELKLWLFEVCIGSHSFAMFDKKFYGHVAYVDDPLPNIVHIAVWVPACIIWLYYASSLTVWWFSYHFFLLSVWSP